MTKSTKKKLQNTFTSKPAQFLGLKILSSSNAFESTCCHEQDKFEVNQNPDWTACSLKFPNMFICFAVHMGS